MTETVHSRYTGLAILRFIFEAIASFGIKQRSLSETVVESIADFIPRTFIFEKSDIYFTIVLVLAD